MRYFVALIVALCVSPVSAQDFLFSNSYSTPDYGYGYSTSTYGWSGYLGQPLQPFSSYSYTTPDYGYGRSTSTYGFGGYGYGYSPSYVRSRRSYPIISR